jgi:hypothetical protein
MFSLLSPIKFVFTSGPYYPKIGDADTLQIKQDEIEKLFTKDIMMDDNSYSPLVAKWDLR